VAVAARKRILGERGGCGVVAAGRRRGGDSGVAAGWRNVG